MTDWLRDELEDEIDDIRGRIARHGEALKGWFVARDREIDLATLCAAVGEPLLFVGPPGTAKSDLVLRFVEAMGLGAEDYFEYMLTKFTEPSEILGPIDIGRLKEGRFRRRTEGMLPEARVVFLDEIFKSNSAILNTLLTIINERKFYQDGAPTPVAMRLLFAATNEIPEQTELQALADRFVLKVETRPVQERHFGALVEAGMRGEALRAVGRKPWASGPARLDDFLKFKRYMELTFAEETATQREHFFPPALFAEFRRLTRVLEAEDKIYISDRKVVKLYKLIRAAAFLSHGGAVTRQDLKILSYAANQRHELNLVYEKVHALLGLEAG